MAPEISTPRPYDEARLARASKLVQASYAALNLALLTHYALSRDLYHTGLALGTLALFPVMHVFYRLTRLKRVHQMDIFIYIFTLIAYTGGELLGGYAQLKSLTNLRFANESARPLANQRFAASGRDGNAFLPQMQAFALQKMPEMTCTPSFLI